MNKIKEIKWKKLIIESERKALHYFFFLKKKKNILEMNIQKKKMRFLQNFSIKQFRLNLAM